MDRRRFLTGTSAGIGAAALGAFVKPAPTPFVEGIIPEAVIVCREVFDGIEYTVYEDEPITVYQRRITDA